MFTPSSAASVRWVGSFSPGSYAPVRIWSQISRKT